MANEHTLMVQKTLPISMTCADGTGIEKGTVLAMSDLNTAAASAAEKSNVAGIAYTEKLADNGETQIAVLSGPGDELRAYASGAIAVGDSLGTGDAAFPNHLISLSGAVDLSGAIIIGYSKEDAAAGNTFKYVLQIQNAQFSG
jgi:hypothetical protein